MLCRKLHLQLLRRPHTVLGITAGHTAGSGSRRQRKEFWVKRSQTGGRIKLGLLGDSGEVKSG